MDAGTFDGVLRRAAKTIDRRGSLKILGGGVAGVSTALGWRAGAADAGNKGNKGKKRCRQQRGQCLAFVQRRCARATEKRETEGPTEVDPRCVADFNPCCDSFAKCQAGAGLRCLTARRDMEAA